MLVYGLSPGDVAGTVLRVSAVKYDGNVTTEYAPRADGAAVRFTLRAHSSKGAGARRSHSGRRSIAVSWQAHYDVMDALLSLGATRIKTAMADYRGADGPSKLRDTYAGRFDTAREAFDTLADRVADMNVGSAYSPVAFGDL